MQGTNSCIFFADESKSDSKSAGVRILRMLF
jgi:hypothetical protein